MKVKDIKKVLEQASDEAEVVIYNSEKDYMAACDAIKLLTKEELEQNEFTEDEAAVCFYPYD